MSDSVSADAFPPKPMPVVSVGVGPEGFIYNAAWTPSMRATGRYAVVGACVENRADFLSWSMANYNLHDPGQVTTNFDDMVRRGLDQFGNDLILTCTLPTHLHAKFISRAVELGVMQVITDKPVCPNWGDYSTLMNAMQGARGWVTFNHNYMTPVLALRALVGKYGVASVENIETGFLQDWLMTDPKIRQSGWRLKDRFGGLTDIGSHAGMLAAWVMQEKIMAVSAVEMSTVGDHGADCLDNGSMDLHFNNGVMGSMRFHQALPGHADDIYCVVTFKEGVLPEGIRRVMFRMEWCPDGLFYSCNAEVDIHDQRQWDYTPHRPGVLIDANLMSLRFTPPGHMEGWPNGWQRLFCAIAGDIWRSQAALSRGEDQPFADALTGNFALPAPKLSSTGRHSMAFLDAVMQGYESGEEEGIRI